MKDRMTAAEFKKLHGGGDISVTIDKKPQIRMPAPAKMNKTESEWMDFLKRPIGGNVDVRYEPITFKLPSGTRYTPDFMRRWNDTGEIEFWEVKGPHIHNSRSIHAFKECASAFPMFTFKFAQKSKEGWRTT